MKKEILVIVLLLFVIFPAVRSLLLPGGFTSHDMTHHIVRQISMDKLLREGQFPPRWSSELAYGYGYPVFLFNYPLPVLVGEVFHLVGLNFLYSVKALLLLSLILSTFGMYIFLLSLVKSRLAAFLGAVFYLYAPIHLIVVYVSGAVGASLALVFPPFVLWAVHKLWEGNTRFLAVGAVSFAGLILSHNVTAFVFTPIILGFVFILNMLKPDRRFVLTSAFMFILGLGLSSFFWLPAIAEKQFIRYDELMKGIYIDQFPSLSQIIYSPWGYGLSHPKQPEGGMSYQIGLIHIFVTIVLMVFLWLYRKSKFSLALGSFSLLIFLVGVFFMLEVSLPLWKSVPMLSYIQFPVRLLIVPTFAASLAAALLVKHLPFSKIIFLFLFVLVLYANRNHLGINQKYDPGEEYYKSIKTTTTSFDENLPVWVGRMRTNTEHDKFDFIQGIGKVYIREDRSARVVGEFEATSTAKVRFNQYFFPGWKIFIDEKETPFDYLSAGDNKGLPVFDLPEGKHIVKAAFTNTPVRNLADFISVITVIVLMAITVIITCRKPAFLKRE